MNKFLIILFIFLFSLGLRLWNLNQMGRTWDEGAYIVDGYNFINLIKKGDFSNPKWYSNPDHPPLARYLYGLASHLDVEKFDKSGNPIFKYDWTFSRILAVLSSSFSVVLVSLIGFRYISFFGGIIAGLILAMLPVFLGYSQIATLESLILFFFTASVYSFIRLMERYSVKKIIFVGIITGLALEVKQSNLLLIPLFFLIYVMWYLNRGVKEYKSFFNKHLYAIVIVSFVGFLTFIFLWPMPWLHLKSVIEFHNKMWVQNVQLPPPEVFFGKLMLVPAVYYPVYFLITTPILIISFFLIGLKSIDLRKNWVLCSIIIWFCFPFIQSFYSFRQHGIRYIIEIYAPLAIISAVGIDFMFGKLNRKTWIGIFSVFAIFIYLFIILIKISPYYLDYFNEIVGGSKNVYSKKLFQMGWWGQGIKEAGIYLEKNANAKSTVGLAISPVHVMYPLPDLKMSKYSDKKQYDYVIVNYFNVLREGFNDSQIRRDYINIYSVLADGATLVDIYKRK